MTLPKYPRHKDSGVEWLGEVPDHWQVGRFSRVVQAIKDGTHGTFARVAMGRPLLSAKNVQNGAVLVSEDESLISERDHESIVANGFPRAGDLLLTIVGSIGRACVYALPHPVAFQRSVCFLRLRGGNDTNFFFYFTQSKFFQEHLSSRSKAAAQGGVYMGDVIAAPVAVPPLLEQKGIADFLDREIFKIDALVAEQRRLIELLTEERRAVVSHAVTRGLNSHAPMKDSGSDWFGEVPAHWRVVAARRVIRAIEQGWSPECYARPAEPHEWGVVKSGCVNRGLFSPDENKALPEQLTPIPEYEIRVGDVLMSRASGSPELVGSIAYVDSTRAKLMLSDKIFRITLESSVDRRFFAALFSSRALRCQVEQAISGAEGLANNLPQAAIMKFHCVIPPLEEQRAIVDHIKINCDRIDGLVLETRHAIDLLLERRIALISAAVTGQVDVRRMASRVA